MGERSKIIGHEDDLRWKIDLQAVRAIRGADGKVFAEAGEKLSTTILVSPSEKNELEQGILSTRALFRGARGILNVTKDNPQEGAQAATARAEDVIVVEEKMKIVRAFEPAPLSDLTRPPRKK